MARSEGKSKIEGNAAIKEYPETGHITVNRWNEETLMLEASRGIIPIPPDRRDALLFDFAYYLGDPTDPIVKDPDGTSWDVLEPEEVGTHLPYGTPLSEEQMKKLISGGGRDR